MAKEWKDMSWQEKREQRFHKWLNPPGINFSSPEAGKNYQARVSRIIKAVTLEEPDRVPVVLPIGFIFAQNAGTTYKEMAYNYSELDRAWKQLVQDFDSDAFNGPGMVASGIVNEMLDYRLMKWPGHGLAAHMPSYQFVEAEYMKADEYDAFLTDPLDYAIRYYTPRIYGSLAPLQKINLLGLLLGFPNGLIASSQMLDVKAMVKTIEKAGKETMKWNAVVMDANRYTLEAGFPPFRGGACFAPFDIIGDLFRGTNGVARDMFRQPGKLQQAMEKLLPILTQVGVGYAGMAISPLVFMPLHKGDDTFMSDSQFEKFYWPTLRQVCLNLIDEGLVPQLFAEGKYTKRLRQICDLPRGSVMWIFDQTDMVEAKKSLGEKACIAGNVPTSLMVKGKPEDVKSYCRTLIKTCGEGGGYILMGGADIDQGNLDNLHAMMEAAKKYGVYS